MKILLICSLCLISGPVSGSDVIGYSGGSVIIYCKHEPYGMFNKYFCKETPKECAYVRVQNRWTHKERVSLYDSSKDLTVIYRNLSSQDAGLYRCGEAGEWNHTMNLKVNTDPCCSGPTTVTGDLGQTVTISCSYPEQFKPNIKYFYKQEGPDVTDVIDTTTPQRGRFSISDNTGSKVVSVRISDVREEDGGVYYCGAWKRGGSVSYYSLYTEIQLQVTANESPTPKHAPPMGPNSPMKLTTASTEITSDEGHSTAGSPIIIIIIITVCVCAALLLIGGSALIYILRRKKTQKGSVSSSNVATTGSNHRNSHSACDYEEIRDTRPNSDTGSSPVSVKPSSDSSETVYAYAELPPNPTVQDVNSAYKPNAEAHTYDTVSFQNEDSLTDATVVFNTDKSASE